MKNECAWCHAEIPENTTEQGPARYITYGLCAKCHTELLRELSEPVTDFLDRLDEPVLLVDANTRVRTANRSARLALGKDLSDIQGRLGGEVIDCINSCMPEGCGGTFHCQSCTIRKTVAETYRTGKSFHAVPAYPDIQKVEGTRRLELLISTEKVGQVVLLRIEQAEQGR